MSSLDSLGIFLIWVTGYMAAGTWRLVTTPYPVRLDDFIMAVLVAVFWPFTVPIILIDRALSSRRKV